MVNKTKNKIYSQFSHNHKRGSCSSNRFFNRNKIVTIVGVFALLFFIFQPFFIVREVQAAGIDDVLVSLPTGAISTNETITIDFTHTNLAESDSFTIYIGEDTSGAEFGLNSVATTDIACVDDSTGETYTIDSIDAATAALPLRVGVTLTTAGAGGNKEVTCTIGDGSPDPTTPDTADGYSVSVVTPDDSGAGIAYVGGGNDITLSVEVLPNLSLTIDNADGTDCVTTSSVTACDLGAITTATVVDGNYDINVGTNAGSGATISINADAQLDSGGNDIDAVTVENTVDAGTEEHGISVVENGTAWTEDVAYDVDMSPIPVAEDVLATAGGVVDKSAHDITITHEVAISSSTAPGQYDQVITWTATANF